MVWVTKANGSTEPYDRQKVLNTCLKLGANRVLATDVADKVERRLYDGIPTKKILSMLSQYLKQHQPSLGERTDLKNALSLLRGKPDWERFVQLLFAELGYQVDANLTLRGRCVNCEIDAVLKKGDERILAEAKHHSNPHARVDLNTCREVRAVIEDLADGYRQGSNTQQFTGALIVCNTRFTDLALQYAKCRGIECLGWNVPKDNGISTLIEQKQLYPLTMLRRLDPETQQTLGDAGIVLLKQLVTTSLDGIADKTGVDKAKLQELSTSGWYVIHEDR